METLKTNAEGYNYKYTDLAGIHEYLEKIGVSYYQFIEVIEGNDYIMTVAIVDGKELAPKRGCRVVQATLSGKSNPAQEQGSALTYARRYSLLMAFGLATEDDDAESLTKAPTAPRTIKNEGVAQSYQRESSVRPTNTTAPHSGTQSSEVELATGPQKYVIEKLGGVVTIGMTKIEASELISRLKS